MESNDPLTNMMMSGSTYNNNNYNFGPQQPIPRSSIEITKQNQHQMPTGIDGLNATLAPSAFDKAASKHVLDIDGTADGALGENFFESAMAGKDEGLSTPGLDGEGWDTWINDAQWDIPTASQ